MKNEVAKLKDHYIVCGFGRIGKPVADGLKAEGYPLCVLENDHELEEHLQGSGHLYLIGDATDELVLQSAGLNRAKAVLALLSSDADNLFLTITAKELSPSVMVIARASEDRVVPKLKRGGGQGHFSLSIRLRSGASRRRSAGRCGVSGTGHPP